MSAKLLIVSGPVIVEGGAVLLVKHGDDPFWKFPGGRVHGFEETLRDTTVRRAKEELGLTLQLEEREPYFLYVKKPTEIGEIDVVLVHFLARSIGTVVPGTEISKWAWIKLDQLPSDLGPNIRPALQFFGL